MTRGLEKPATRHMYLLSRRTKRNETRPMNFHLSKTLKFLHSLASAGLIGGLSAYLALLWLAPQDTAETYVAMRQSISAINTFVLIPSLGIVIVSGLFAMAAHTPFLKKRWVGVKAVMGILVFKGGVTIAGMKSGEVADLGAQLD
ncbi:MAG: hypothetical protein AAF638_12015, partial [Pseudomonadota bacterium]